MEGLHRAVGHGCCFVSGAKLDMNAVRRDVIDRPVVLSIAQAAVLEGTVAVSLLGRPGMSRSPSSGLNKASYEHFSVWELSAQNRFELRDCAPLVNESFVRSRF